MRKLAGKKRAGFEEIAARLPAETRLYVPRIMATVSLREKISDPAGLPAPRMETAGVGLEVSRVFVGR